MGVNVSVKQSQKRRYIRHDEEFLLCSRCLKEPALPGQRYGRECRNEASRKHRRTLAQQAAAFRLIAESVFGIGSRKTSQR